MTREWKTYSLGDLLQRTETVNPASSPDTAFDYIDVSSVSNATFRIETTQRLRGREAPSRARKLVKTDDVLFATIRPTLQRVAVVPRALNGQVCSTGYFVLRPRTTLHHRFLFHYLLSGQFKERMELLQKGASYPAVTDQQVRDQEIPLPPLPEQKRIVGILDEALEGIATAKTNAERNLANAHEAFESYLAGIFANRGPGWVDRQLATLCVDVTVGHVGPVKDRYSTAGIPFLRSQNIRPFELAMDDVMYIDDAFDAELKKSRLRPGDLAIVRTGYPGTAAVIPPDLAQANCADLVVVRPGKEVNPHFLEAFFNSSFGKALVLGKLVGAAQRHFNVGAAKAVQLHLPPLREQNTIVAAITRLRAETQQLSRLVEQKHAALYELKQSLLNHAFTGQL